MSEEEILGELRLIRDRVSQTLDILARMEARQIEVKEEIEAEPVQGSFGAVDK